MKRRRPAHPYRLPRQLWLETSGRTYLTVLTHLGYRPAESILPRFEEAFAAFSGTRYALSCCNGTVALHLALLALGIEPGDEVLLPTLTYVATANAVAYCGAKPVFVDSELSTWNLDPNAIEAKITSRTKAIIVVHIYGHPADLDPILEIARKHSLHVIEDAAEAHGAEYKGTRVGSLGDISDLQFLRQQDHYDRRGWDGVHR